MLVNVKQMHPESIKFSFSLVLFERLGARTFSRTKKGQNLFRTIVGVEVQETQRTHVSDEALLIRIHSFPRHTLHLLKDI